MAVVVFYGLHDVTLEAPDDDAYDLVIAVASGQIEYPAVAGTLAAWRTATR